MTKKPKKVARLTLKPLKNMTTFSPTDLEKVVGGDGETGATLYSVFGGFPDGFFAADDK